MFDPTEFIHSRALQIDASGIRRVFDLAAKLKDPINFSIGQPDFDVPQPIKDAAIAAIEQGHNSYTVTQGTQELREKIIAKVQAEFPQWQPVSSTQETSQTARNGHTPFGALITSGVSGGLLLALMATVGPGDEVLIADPYFVMYAHLVRLVGATPVFVDTYPDFQITAARLESHVTKNTKLLMFNSPSNPTGVVATPQICKDVVELADKHNFLILSDEIYDEFCHEKVETDGVSLCPSPAAFSDHVLLLRGFSKTYGMTGWRLGYAIGPAAIIEQMTKLQQYTFVCAPSMVQFAGALSLDVDVSEHVAAYRKKRDRVVQVLAGSGQFELTTPGGAFYAFPKVPEHLNLTGTQFVEKAIARNLLIIPGKVFSTRDTHFRISYACDDAKLEQGLEVLLELAAQ
jgi:aspartate/methionine/tyrosine aminotransferase